MRYPYVPHGCFWITIEKRHVFNTGMMLLTVAQWYWLGFGAAAPVYCWYMEKKSQLPDHLNTP